MKFRGIIVKKSDKPDELVMLYGGQVDQKTGDFENAMFLSRYGNSMGHIRKIQLREINFLPVIVPSKELKAGLKAWKKATKQIADGLLDPSQLKCIHEPIPEGANFEPHFERAEDFPSLENFAQTLNPQTQALCRKAANLIDDEFLSVVPNFDVSTLYSLVKRQSVGEPAFVFLSQVVSEGKKSEPFLSIKNFAALEQDTLALCVHVTGTKIIEGTSAIPQSGIQALYDRVKNLSAMGSSPN